MKLVEGENGVWKLAEVGSRVTCNPPPTDTDRDILVLCTAEGYSVFEGSLNFSGFVFEGNCEYANDVENGEGFASFRMGEVNLIVTVDEEFFKRFMAATSVAKRLNLMDKADRIVLFQAVVYGNACDEVRNA